MEQKFILLLFLLLIGCGESSSKFYIWGPSNLCFKNGLNKNCISVKPYDTLTLSINKQSQEVSYQIRGARLDDSNVKFVKLSNCNIVDLDNFTCDGLTNIDGKITEHKSFENKTITKVWWLFSSFNILGSSLKKEDVEFIDRNNFWITPVGIFLILIMSLASG